MTSSLGPRSAPARTRKAGVRQRAGTLLAAARMSSAHAVDAFVVATALEFELALIASGDPKNIRRLAADYPQISVLAL